MFTKNPPFALKVPQKDFFISKNFKISPQYYSVIINEKGLKVPTMPEIDFHLYKKGTNIFLIKLQ